MFNNKSNLVTNSLEIYNLLKNIQKSKQLISLSFDSLPQHCLTSLLEVHHDTKVLIFDEPNPKLSSTLTAQKDEAEFSLKLESLPIKFKSKFILNNTESEFNDLYTPFPTEIFYPQNRDYYRFRTESIENIDATIFLPRKRKLPFELINISLNGLCIRLPYSFAQMFQINQLLDDIYIQLPEQNAFSISAKIKNARIEKNYSNIIFGLQIHKQKTVVEKVIQQFIFRSDNN